MNQSSQAIRAAKTFEFYVKYIWPIHRIFAQKKISQRCHRCAASVKMIPLTAGGICETCASDSSTKKSDPDRTEENTQLLNKILLQSQNAGTNGYDALVLFSGGKDSTYLIRRIQHEFPQLRLLAFTVDNGFMSSVAKENIQELIPALGIDHIFYQPKKEVYNQLFRYTLTHLDPIQGGYGTVDFSDGELLLDLARNTAAEKRIPLILCGYSKYQVQNGLKLQSFESPREIELADRTHSAGLKLTEIFESKDLGYWWKGTQWPAEQVSRLIFPLYCWNLEEEQIKAQVEKWGLLPRKNVSPIVTNHRLVPLIGVVDVHNIGYSSFEIEFCRMIREGKANKADWQPIFEFLEYTSRSGLFLKETVLASLKEIGLTAEDVGIRFQK